MATRTPKFTTGTIVQIRTTNGGLITAPLLENHYHTYDALLDCGPGHWVAIPAHRIVSIQEYHNRG